MSGERAVSLLGAFACRDSQESLVFGERPDGTIAHISEVPSGLSCDCVCPGCRSRLVARKGQKNNHHFGHEGSIDGRPCKTGPETALHKVAKEVLARRLALFLPPLEIADGEDRWIGFKGGNYRFDAAVLENRLGDIIPDVIVHKGDRDLLIEFAVTHECGPEKIARIRARGISAIEIDLSELPRDVSRDGLEYAILVTAPRKWLNNPKLAEGEAYLESRRQRRAEALARRAASLRRAYLAAVSELRSLRIPCLEVGRIDEDELTRATGIEVLGMGCFTVPPRVWQATILADAVDLAASGERHFITAGGALRKLRERGWLHHRLGRVTEAEADAIRADGTDFGSPVDAITAWLFALSRMAILMPSSGGSRWVLHPITVDSVRSIRRRRTLPGLRLADIRKTVADILENLPEDEMADFSFEQWVAQPLPSIGCSISEAVHLEDTKFAQVQRALEAITVSIRTNPQRDTDLMELPLSGLLARRVEERRREREELEQARRERERQEGEERAAWIFRYSRDKLGVKDLAWISSPNSELQGLSPIDAARESLQGLREAADLVDSIVYRRMRDLRAAQIAEDAAKKAREELRREAAKIHKGEHLDVYMNASHPALGRKSPLDFCVDETTLRECIELTIPVRKRRR